MIPPHSTILRVAVPSPLYRLFDYLPPANDDGPFRPGMRVRVPFGRTRTVGIIVDVVGSSDVPASKLKRVHARIDDVPLLPAEIMKLAAWSADYYHHPHGEVLAAMVPAALRAGAPAQLQRAVRWRCTTAGLECDPASLTRAPRQAAVLARLRAAPDGVAQTTLAATRAVMEGLRDKGLVERFEPAPRRVAPRLQAEDAPTLNDAQAAAVSRVCDGDGFRCLLLDGVTGSGKTEVYLRAIERVIADDKQALVLVPEIALTPQLVARFRDRFASQDDAPAVVVMHSGLSDNERRDAWLRARNGLAPVVIGTRSAVFTPLREPGLIVVDEEHDASFKQQEGFRYWARDLAVWRGRELAVPVLLGSATPSLESLHNVRTGRYGALALPDRAGSARQPTLRLLDVRGMRLRDGMSDALIERMHAHLDSGAQVLLFLNRRGFAPVLQCHDCGWVDGCPRCDARMTLHQRENRMRCHHCGCANPPPARCKACNGDNLRPIGIGTQRVETALAEDFASYKCVRIDRDATRRKGAFESLIDEVHRGEARILVGTQMLAKGHHFPGVTLVAVLDADHGLFSADFRASERMAQLIVQVSGRAGRAGRAGEVLIQTRSPAHPLLQALVVRGYQAFADAALEEREAASLPPSGHIALLRAEAVETRAPERFLDAARGLAALPAGVQWLGPVPAPMARRAGRDRAQVMLLSRKRAPLQALLGELVPRLSTLKQSRRVRWSIDVDPADTF